MHLFTVEVVVHPGADNKLIQFLLVDILKSDEGVERSIIGAVLWVSPAEFIKQLKIELVIIREADIILLEFFGFGVIFEIDLNASGTVLSGDNLRSKDHLIVILDGKHDHVG